MRRCEKTDPSRIVAVVQWQQIQSGLLCRVIPTWRESPLASKHMPSVQLSLCHLHPSGWLRTQGAAGL